MSAARQAAPSFAKFSVVGLADLTQVAGYACFQVDQLLPLLLIERHPIASRLRRDRLHQAAEAEAHVQKYLG